MDVKPRQVKAKAPQRLIFLMLAFRAFGFESDSMGQETVDLARATVVIRKGELPKAEQTAARMLVEELKKRIGKTLPISTSWPKQGPVIVLTSKGVDPEWGHALPQRQSGDQPETRTEGYRVFFQNDKILWIAGADPRGTLFGAGRLLRAIEWQRGSARLPASFDVGAAPVSAIRGHQLGYRARANSYDGWDKKQYEQYIRELVIFGANSIENIRFEDTQASPHWPVPRMVMNRQLSEI